MFWKTEVDEIPQSRMNRCYSSLYLQYVLDGLFKWISLNMNVFLSVLILWNRNGRMNNNSYLL